MNGQLRFRLVALLLLLALFAPALALAHGGTCRHSAHATAPHEQHSQQQEAPPSDADCPLAVGSNCSMGVAFPERVLSLLFEPLQAVGATFSNTTLPYHMLGLAIFHPPRS